VAGTGTLAMELAVANVVEAGDRVVVVTTGWFGERMVKIIERLGATADVVRADVGDVPDLDAIEREVSRAACKALVVTHVDTSTGVLTPLESIAKIGKKHGALVISDGVCAIGAEMLRQDAWGIDIALTGSQKALGVPPGLALAVFSQAALAATKARKTKVASLYLDVNEWLPIMQGYESGSPLYFATPAVNLITALEVSLQNIAAEGMEARAARHVKMATAFRAGARALGISLVPKRDGIAAHTMSALWYPEGVDPSFVGYAKEEGLVLTGGLQPEVKTKYFRVGHMGIIDPSDIVSALAAIERALARAGRKVEFGAGVGAAQAELAKRPG
jgi:alanine-glyoxylate transaminase/serine-glyoxylate transaminase/serine-pyruvate transaminase